MHSRVPSLSACTPARAPSWMRSPLLLPCYIASSASLIFPCLVAYPPLFTIRVPILATSYGAVRLHLRFFSLSLTQATHISHFILAHPLLLPMRTQITLAGQTFDGSKDGTLRGQRKVENVVQQVRTGFFLAFLVCHCSLVCALCVPEARETSSAVCRAILLLRGSQSLF